MLPRIHDGMTLSSALAIRSFVGRCGLGFLFHLLGACGEVASIVNPEMLASQAAGTSVKRPKLHTSLITCHCPYVS